MSSSDIPDDIKSLTGYVTAPVFPDFDDDPGLPAVLLVGDSISMYYTPEVRRLLHGKANVHRIPDNGKSTRHGMANLERWLGDRGWGVIHFNFGLHDIAITEAGASQVSLDEYERNLRRIVEILRATGARLIWATTTPVPDGSNNRSERDNLSYNATANRIVEGNRIPVNDLHAFVESREDKDLLQLPANVHFRAEGSIALAGEVAKAIFGAICDAHNWDKRNS